MEQKIYKTTDYSVFKKLKGNREVEDRRVKGLIKSIRTIGWVTNPIIVNQKMEVIDGQGRLKALQNEGLPVEYIIFDGEESSLNCCRIMNSNNKGWGTTDFVKSFADSGNKDYQRLIQVMRYFKVSLEEVLMARGQTDGGKNYEQLRNGNLKFSESDYINVSRRLNIWAKYVPVFNKFGGRKRTHNKVIFYLIHYGEKHENLDHDKILESLKSYDPQDVYAQTFEKLLESVQRAYNYNKKKKTNRLYFYEEYRLDNNL